MDEAVEDGIGQGGIRATHRRLARPPDPPRAYSRDERRQLPLGSEPETQAQTARSRTPTKPLPQNEERGHKAPFSCRPGTRFLRPAGTFSPLSRAFCGAVRDRHRRLFGTLRMRAGPRAYATSPSFLTDTVALGHTLSNGKHPRQHNRSEHVIVGELPKLWDAQPTCP
jgi:hypothetical protein